MSKSKSKTHTSENKLQELEHNWKRALADYQNLQKRFTEEREAIIKFANTSLLLRILPVLDNLQLMAKHNDDIGLKMVIKEFEKVLKEENLEEIDVENKIFDPLTMDAIEMIEGEEDKVLEVVQKGYKFKNKILRPARVKVGQKKEEK